MARPDQDTGKLRDAIAMILRQHEIDDSLALELLCNLDEFYARVWVNFNTGQHFVETVDLAGAQSRQGRADRDELLGLSDLAGKLARGLEGLAQRSLIRNAQINDKLSGPRTEDFSRASRQVELAIKAVVHDMGKPPSERQGNRVSEDGEASLRLLQVLRSAGVADDSKCARVISRIFSETGRSHSPESLLKRFQRSGQK
jgi:hypothetical protein